MARHLLHDVEPEIWIPDANKSLVITVWRHMEPVNTNSSVSFKQQFFHYFQNNDQFLQAFSFCLLFEIKTLCLKLGLQAQRYL